MFSLLFVLASSRIHRRHRRFEPNGTGDSIVSYARGKLGCSYVYGSAGPSTFDCSGLAQWCHKQVGISLPRTASEQSGRGSSVSWNSLQPGDLMFFDTAGSGRVTHVGIYSGSNKMIHAPKPGDVVKEASLQYYWPGCFVCARRNW